MTLLDTINLIFTIASLVFTLITAFQAKRAKQYKEEVLHLRDAFDLENLLGKFITESKYFQDNTRDKEWYKGQGTDKINSIISPFKETLLSFGSSYHLFSHENRGDVKYKVSQLNSIVNNYDRANDRDIQKTNKLILEITNILQDEVHSNKDKIVKN